MLTRLSLVTIDASPEALDLHGEFLARWMTRSSFRLKRVIDGDGPVTG